MLVLMACMRVWGLRLLVWIHVFMLYNLVFCCFGKNSTFKAGTHPLCFPVRKHKMRVVFYRLTHLLHKRGVKALCTAWIGWCWCCFVMRCVAVKVTPLGRCVTFSTCPQKRLTQAVVHFMQELRGCLHLDVNRLQQTKKQLGLEISK